jgi:hypothetical protein
MDISYLLIYNNNNLVTREFLVLELPAVVSLLKIKSYVWKYYKLLRSCASYVILLILFDKFEYDNMQWDRPG